MTEDKDLIHIRILELKRTLNELQHYLTIYDNKILEKQDFDIFADRVGRKIISEIQDLKNQ